MTHYILMFFARLIRFVRKWVLGLSLVVFLFALNIATLVSNTVYDVLGRLVWGAAELVSDEISVHRPKSRTEMEAETARTRAQADAATTEARKVRSDLDSARTETTHVRAQFDEANIRNRALIADLEQKDRRIAEMVIDIDETRKTRQRAMEAVGGLRGRIVRSIRRDASTEALEAIPFVGTAVFLGSVAYDLNDGCQQLRDLETLDAALRGKEPAQVSEAMCLMSYEDMVAALTGKDRAYARCVSDRVLMNDLSPPSCVGYDPALPEIKDSILITPVDAPLLPRIE